MKKYVIILLSLLFIQNTEAQTKEFETNKNGLIYSENAINKLRKVADSLNLKYSVCELDKKYISLGQTLGAYYNIPESDRKQSLKLLEAKTSISEFDKMFSKYKKDSTVLIRSAYKDYSGEDVVKIEKFPSKNYYAPQIKYTKKLEKYKGSLKNQWLYFEGSTNLIVFYPYSDFLSEELPKKYARMVGYSNCMIDTSATKFKENLKNGDSNLPKDWEKMNQFEKDQLLEELRETRVIGYCSQDSRPREHALNIAKVSAESYNWQIFLRSHLDIMNDRFERVSDGSYAHARRLTYIKELEAINIDVTKLLYGISLRVSNPSKNHYYGSIYRLGRALSEIEDSQQVEHQLQAIINDTELDYYNRIVMYYLYNNYLYYKVGDQASAKNQFECNLPEFILADLD